MKTTIIIKDELINEAGRLVGVTDKTKLVRMGLEALITHESARRLAKLGCTEKGLRSIERRKRV
jgi:Arc/MetJ family transcription regulator